MGLQIKVFFRSKLRVLLLAVLVLCSGWQFIQTAYAVISQNLERFGRIGTIYGTLQDQMGDFLYIFILFLFLSFDYFREVSNGNVLEILRASRGYIRHDIKSFLVLTGILTLYTGLLLGYYLGRSAWNGMLPWQIFFYFLKMFGLYVFLNGLVAILMGWLLSRVVGRLIGYLCIILFSVLVSPILTSTLSFFAMWYREIFHWFRIFVILPQGYVAVSDDAVIFPVNLTLAARTFFWLGCLTVAITLYYLGAKKEKNHAIQWGILGLGTLVAVGSWIYSGLPASFYNRDDSLSATDAMDYDQWHYVIDGTEQASRDNDFVVRSYEMKFKLRRQMEAEVILYPEETTCPVYDMTLYHLYQIDSITDQAGRELFFQRDADCLTVENTFGNLEAICIRYHGGGARFYSNWSQVNLPGWLPYYPIPGWHAIYDAENYEYYCNTLPYAVPFDVTIDAGATVYSELERTEGNHFTGVSSGPTFVAGFLREDCYEDGIRLVYPYWSDAYNPESEYCSEAYQELLKDMREAGKKTIIITPTHAGDSAYISQGDYVVDFASWALLIQEYEELGEFSRIPLPEPTEERAREGFLQNYYLVFATDEYEDFLYYENVLDSYLTWMGEWGYTEEDFEDFILENLGQEAWDRIKEMEHYVAD